MRGQIRGQGEIGLIVISQNASVQHERGEMVCIMRMLWGMPQISA